MPTFPTFRIANGTQEEAAVLADLVQRAYRGKGGWTTEAAIIKDRRIDTEGVLKKIQDPNAHVLVAELDGTIIGCCEIILKTNEAAYFGMLAVEPKLQAGGLGRTVLAEAEKKAKEVWGVSSMEMTVIASREELLEWYQRRGYTKTGATQPFPADANNGIPLVDLQMVVLSKRI